MQGRFFSACGLWGSTLAFSPSQLSDAQVGQPYEVRIAISGNSGPHCKSVNSNSQFRPPVWGQTCQGRPAIEPLRLWWNRNRLQRKRRAAPPRTHFSSKSGHHERLVLVPMNRIGTICRQQVHVVLVAAAGNQAATRPSMSALTFQNSSGRS
jgi:hypothetical protein